MKLKLLCVGLLFLGNCFAPTKSGKTGTGNAPSSPKAGPIARSDFGSEVGSTTSFQSSGLETPRLGRASASSGSVPRSATATELQHRADFKLALENLSASEESLNEATQKLERLLSQKKQFQKKADLDAIERQINEAKQVLEAKQIAVTAANEETERVQARIEAARATAAEQQAEGLRRASASLQAMMRVAQSATTAARPTIPENMDLFGAIKRDREKNDAENRAADERAAAARALAVDYPDDGRSTSPSVARSAVDPVVQRAPQVPAGSGDLFAALGLQDSVVNARQKKEIARQAREDEGLKQYNDLARQYRIDQEELALERETGSGEFKRVAVEAPQVAAEEAAQKAAQKAAERVVAFNASAARDAAIKASDSKKVGFVKPATRTARPATAPGKPAIAPRGRRPAKND